MKFTCVSKELLAVTCLLFTSSAWATGAGPSSSLRGVTEMEGIGGGSVQSEGRLLSGNLETEENNLLERLDVLRGELEGQPELATELLNIEQEIKDVVTELGGAEPDVDEPIIPALVPAQPPKRGKVRVLKIEKVKCIKPAKSISGGAKVLISATAAAAVFASGVLAAPATGGASLVFSAKAAAVVAAAGVPTVTAGVVGNAALAGAGLDWMEEIYPGTDDLYISANGHKVFPGPTQKYVSMKSQQEKDINQYFRLPVTIGFYEYDYGSADDFMGSFYLSDKSPLNGQSIVFHESSDEGAAYWMDYSIMEVDESSSLARANERTATGRYDKHPAGAGCGSDGECASGDCMDISSFCQCKPCNGSGCGGCAKGTDCHNLSIYEPNVCLAIGHKFSNGSKCKKSSMCHSGCCSWTSVGANTCEKDSWYRNCT